MVIKFVCAWVFHGVPRDCGMFSLCCVFSSLSVLFFVLKRSSVLGYVIVCFVIVLKWARGVWFASSHVWARSYTSAGLIANVTFTCVLMRQRKRWYGFFLISRVANAFTFVETDCDDSGLFSDFARWRAFFFKNHVCLKAVFVRMTFIVR